MDGIGASNDDLSRDPISSDSAKANSTGFDADRGIEMQQAKPPAVMPFSVKKREEQKRAKTQKANTIKHVLVLKDKSIAFDIFILPMDSGEYGDQHSTLNYSMDLKYEEDSDLSKITYDLEHTMKPASDATTSVVSDKNPSTT
ncbi:Hypothetical protein PHPALM_14071 [Phytophthora palmivora]|uniref:Uncharacterized protein n=1 Tax=Phytophthora palmivora TaxID=4796 RepID=A0A2P4XVQ2_9STRA|nr:Hypothetical protein PHPALM_14071 [Phytophthora palmivora]